jgi:hypothetical protein
MAPPSEATVLRELRAVLAELSPEEMESTTQRQIFSRVTDALGGAPLDAHRAAMRAEIDSFLVVVGSQSEPVAAPAPAAAAPAPAPAAGGGKRPRPAAWRRGAGATGCARVRCAALALRGAALRCAALRLTVRATHAPARPPAAAAWLTTGRARSQLATTTTTTRTTLRAERTRQVRTRTACACARGGRTAR